ncbi:hypothetical protein FRAHR75_280013 [Frankia sp. Hr75.2]|nr:hypothetical protein FRAHR75_280013 [Frankia sp. Hr75.2]
MQLRVNTGATGIDVTGHRLALRGPVGQEEHLPYDKLIIGTGALPAVSPIAGLADPGDLLTPAAPSDSLGPADGVHLLHSMGDTHAIMASIDKPNASIPTPLRSSTA